MAWMFRWLQHIIAHLPFSRDPEAGWVEPSNSITRAVLSPTTLALPEVAPALPERAPAEIVTLPARPQPATRTAQRTRRRRATRAA